MQSFISDGQVTDLQHISGDLSREAANDLANEHEVTDFPVFVLVGADGTTTWLRNEEKLADALAAN